MLFRGRAVLVKAKVSSSGESVAEVPLVLLFNVLLMSFSAVLHKYDHFAGLSKPIAWFTTPFEMQDNDKALGNCRCSQRQYQVFVFEGSERSEPQQQTFFCLFVLNHVRLSVRSGLISMQTRCNRRSWTDSAVVQRWCCLWFNRCSKCMHCRLGSGGWND